ncbi:MAG TPA: VOC family protein [Acidimicrobiaceae bacterium]|nr:VOC family protein [Acidimicrobiaceae bacterium]
MAFHHVAVATSDLPATHRFYSEAMGFTLRKVQVAPTPHDGWAKHLFYDTGGNGMLAVWELHDDTIGSEFPTAISTGLGLPDWVNHIAFDAPDLDTLAAHTRRWQEHGIDVVELDHVWCRSIYAVDPNGILVEFCCSTAPLTEADAKEAARLLADPAPELEPFPTTTVHEALVPAPPS